MNGSGDGTATHAVPGCDGSSSSSPPAQLDASTRLMSAADRALAAMAARDGVALAAAYANTGIKEPARRMQSFLPL